ncbi:MAG: hypothetical protein HRT88_04475 [Lentisphaeraceae bacterium]|nr:hypothetical protein [Lentisphaeraceae bacterium]
MKLCLYVFLCYTFCQSVSAAQWLYGTSLEKEVKEFYGSASMHRDFITSGNRDRKFWQRKRVRLQYDVTETLRQLQSESDERNKKKLQTELYQLRNNQARCLILLGQYGVAFQELIKLESLYPGESIIAENLATCEEKRGNYRKAIHWIKLARQRNTLSAYSSLWVYEQLLIARHQLTTNPTYLLENNVSGISYLQNNSALQAIDVSLKENVYLRFDLAGKAKHIRKQLKTRLQLHDSQSKDPALACLVADLAELYAICTVCEASIPLFELALDLGHPDEVLVQRYIVQLKELIQANPKSNKASRSFWQQMEKSSWRNYLGAFALLMLVLVFWQNKKKGGTR